MNRVKKILTLLLILTIIFSTPLTTIAEDKQNTFKDIESHWAKEAIIKLVEINVFEGYLDGTFKPDNNIRRGEFSKVLREVLGFNLINGNSFEDTTEHWAKEDIHTLIEKKIIDKKNYGEKFRPNENITRAEIARMILKAISPSTAKQAELSTNTNTKFKDNEDILKKDRAIIDIINNTHVMGGYPDNTFRPNGEATRAEVSQIIVNFLKLQEQRKNRYEKLIGDNISQVSKESEVISTSNKQHDFEEIKRLYEYDIMTPSSGLNGYIIWDIKQFNEHGKTLSYESRAYRRQDQDILLTDGLDTITLLHNRNFKDIEEGYLDRLLYNIYGRWYYRGEKLEDTEFPNLLIEETRKWNVNVESEFITARDLVYTNKNGNKAIRGILRIKYNNHDYPSNIQWELEKEGIVMEIGKWYEVDVDIEFSKIFSNVEREHSRVILSSYDYLSEFRELKDYE